MSQPPISKKRKSQLLDISDIPLSESLQSLQRKISSSRSSSSSSLLSSSSSSVSLSSSFQNKKVKTSTHTSQSTVWEIEDNIPHANDGSSEETVVIGVDEVACGCMAGPLAVCAAYIPKSAFITGINDSKQLSATQRTNLFDKMSQDKSIQKVVLFISPKMIDTINILQCRLQGFEMVVDELVKRNPQWKKESIRVIIDGSQAPKTSSFRQQYQFECIPKADSKSYNVAGASIFAKVLRDRYIIELSKQFPEWKWNHNLGYPNPEHLKLIREASAISIHHRRTYGCCKEKPVDSNVTPQQLQTVLPDFQFQSL